MDKRLHTLRYLTLATVLFTFIVIALGAFTRLTNAGLGCPDWPGCYGHMLVPDNAQVIANIDRTHPMKPFLINKARAEMVHRYCAGFLGLLILLVLIQVIRLYRVNCKQYIVPAIFLLALLIYQPILGMWTVTLKLLPIIVTQHLLGGFSMLSLVWLLSLMAKYNNKQAAYCVSYTLRKWAVLGLILLAVQIFLGAWTSTNYAAITCDSFPFCQMAPWHLDFTHAFNFIDPIGINYQGGVLGDNARKTIQMVHRIGALIVVLYWLVLIARILFSDQKPAAILKFSFAIFVMLMIQVALGISNVLFSRPLVIAVLHNLCAAILLLFVVAFNYFIFYYSQHSVNRRLADD